jgi:hypothetical protein
MPWTRQLIHARPTNHVVKYDSLGPISTSAFNSGKGDGAMPRQCKSIDMQLLCATDAIAYLQH